MMAAALIVVITGMAVLFAETSYAEQVKPDNGLPVVYITIDEHAEGYHTIEEMNSDAKHKALCLGTVSIDVPDVEGGFRYSDAKDQVMEDLENQKMEIRGRGNSTWGAKKKPYKIKFENKTNVLGLGKNRHWVLLANAYDKTLVKDRITAWLGDAIGLDFTPRGYPVDVVMRNTDGTYDKYLGSYYLSENVRIDKYRVDIDELKKADEDDTVITGGYIIQNGVQNDSKSPNAFITKHGDWAVDTPNFDPDDGGYVNDKQRNYIVNYVSDLENVMYGENLSDIWEKIDMRSSALYWLVDQASKNGDGYNTGSTYLYKTRDVVNEGVTTPGKLYWGPLWDFDFAWAFGEEEPTGFDVRHDWLRAMFTDRSEGGIVQEVKKQWPAVKSALDEISRDGGLIDSYYEETRRSQAADYVVNPVTELGKDDVPYVVENDYEGWIKALKDWIRARVSWMDEHINDLDNMSHKVTYIVGGKVNSIYYVGNGGVLLGTEDNAPDLDDAVFVGYTDQDGKMIDPDMKVYSDLVLTATYIPEDEATHANELYLRSYQDTMKLGQEAPRQISYSVYPKEAQDKRVVMSSSDETVATVDNKGNVTAKGAGEAEITVKLKYTGVSRKYKIIVTEEDLPLPTSVIADKKAFSLMPGSHAQLTFHTDPALSKVDEYGFDSADDNVVKVDFNGVMTAVKPGSTKVTISVVTLVNNDYVIRETDVAVTVSEANTLKASGRTVKQSRKKLAKKSVTITRSKAIKVTGGKGTVTYSKVGVTVRKKAGKKAKYVKASSKTAAKFRINKKNGNITLKKGLKKGTYKLKVKVAASGNAEYRAGSKNATVTIKVV